eukprot:scaffold13562_cov63-Phaeocystis_antarctica.AAC.9
MCECIAGVVPRRPKYCSELSNYTTAKIIFPCFLPLKKIDSWLRDHALHGLAHTLLDTHTVLRDAVLAGSLTTQTQMYGVR